MSLRGSDRVANIGRSLRAVRRLSLYFVIPALGAVAPLIAIPAITGRYGVDGWAVVAVAVSVGSTAAVVCDLGWGIIGPQGIARAPERAVELYSSSVASKAMALCLLAPITVVLTVLLTQTDVPAAILVAVGTLLTVMSPSWFFIGQGRPGLIMWTDTLPRLVIATGAASAIALGAPLVVYGIGSLAGSVAAVLLATRFGRLPLIPAGRFFRAAPRVIRSQAPLIVGNIVSTAFTSAPTAILAHSSPPVVITTFSAVDRPMRMGLNVLGGVPARLQSWVGTPDPVVARRRSQISIVANLLLGIVAMGAFFFLAPPVSTVLFSGSVTVTAGLAALGGVLAAEICFSRGLGLALVAADRANRISVAVTAGAVVGVVLLLVLPPQLGAAGALLAIIAAEAVMILVQLGQLRSAWKTPARGVEESAAVRPRHRANVRVAP